MTSGEEGEAGSVTSSSAGSTVLSEVTGTTASLHEHSMRGGWHRPGAPASSTEGAHAPSAGAAGTLRGGPGGGKVVMAVRAGVHGHAVTGGWAARHGGRQRSASHSGAAPETVARHGIAGGLSSPRGSLSGAVGAQSGARHRDRRSRSRRG